MHASNSGTPQKVDEKIEYGINGDVTPEEILKGEVLEDAGEIFKSHNGQAEFRSLGW